MPIHHQSKIIWLGFFLMLFAARPWAANDQALIAQRDAADLVHAMQSNDHIEYDKKFREMENYMRSLELKPNDREVYRLKLAHELDRFDGVRRAYAGKRWPASRINECDASGGTSP